MFKINKMHRHTSRAKLTSGVKSIKPRISFMDKSILIKHRLFQDDDTEFIDRPDFISWFLHIKKISDPRSTSVPIVSERLSNGYRIIDLRIDRVKETLKLIQNHCIKTDPLCKSIQLKSDSTSLKILDYILLQKIANWHSFCAIEEGTGKLVGVIIGSLKPKNDQKMIETRIRPHQGETLFYLMTLNSCLMSKCRIYENLNVQSYFRIYMLCVKTKHREKGIGLALVRSIINKSRELESSVCVGAFFSGAALAIGRRLGFQCLGDVSFKDAMIPGGEDPFKDNEVKNEKLYCMALTIEFISEIPIPIDVKPAKKAKSVSNKNIKKTKKK